MHAIVLSPLFPPSFTLAIMYSVDILRSGFYTTITDHIANFYIDSQTYLKTIQKDYWKEVKGTLFSFEESEILFFNFPWLSATPKLQTSMFVRRLHWFFFLCFYWRDFLNMTIFSTLLWFLWRYCSFHLKKKKALKLISPSPTERNFSRIQSHQRLRRRRGRK